MSRRVTIWGFCISVVLLLTIAFGGAILVKLTGSADLKRVIMHLLVIDLLAVIYFGVVTFVSLMTHFLIMVAGPKQIQEKSGNPMFYLQWQEVRAHFERAAAEQRPPG